ncbi:response regulator transcription factor [Aquisalibacillus elongatus]|uniref:DNA-binding response OmpR family regulator n=1 Tax=Aquisalibacillus elongatus TaxID=485577 RepID=A0A3N5B820_9BACI|nr:response regulator transcription factor [Aquisalibacillus elongatus]RPF53483.1 DNA-binding response OmpR family regulator [Aquisalibacillus elongatus]
MFKALVVDDEVRMLDLIEVYLQTHSFICTKTTNAHEALRILEEDDINIMILDIMMPEMSGFELCQKVRTFSNIPIIMLTARDQQEDLIKGLKLGADDYITKPFDEHELVARMEALLRRTQPQNIIETNGLVWDKDKFELSYRNQIIKLTPKEFNMIGYLLRNPHQVYEREKLIDLIWGYVTDVEGRTVDSHIRNIRDKIRKVGFPVDQHLITVWGVGYKWIK